MIKNLSLLYKKVKNLTKTLNSINKKHYEKNIAIFF